MRYQRRENRKYSQFLLLIKVKPKENSLDMIRNHAYSLVRKNGVSIFVRNEKGYIIKRNFAQDVQENEESEFNLSSDECVCGVCVREESIIL